ncbi:MAG: LysM peptidoglycan-binding domain-containing protein [Chloroflexi bacterium]|nr:LysM peptidoglycan-binding domain-containing protein [Chloroflexota bacterium]
MSRNILTIRILLILTILATSLIGTTVFAQSGTVVRVDPVNVSAQVNDNFTVAIKVDNVTNLTAAELHLSFNPAVLEVVGTSNGGFIAADFLAQNLFDNVAGTVDYAVAQMNRPAAQGSGILLNIVFKARGNGISSIALRSTQAVPSGLILSDQNGAAIQASWTNGNANVGNTTPPTATPVTPTPATPTPVTPTSASPTPVTPTPTTPAGGTLGTHVVRWGETLYCIGRAYGVSPYAIASSNGIWWPYVIFPSQSLTIPNVVWSPIPTGPVCPKQFTATASGTATPVPTSVTPTPTGTATPVPPSGCRATYTVVAGDNLFRIGLRYGVSYTEIARVNNIPNPRLIFVGQQLCIP